MYERLQDTAQMRLHTPVGQYTEAQQTEHIFLVYRKGGNYDASKQGQTKATVDEI